MKTTNIRTAEHYQWGDHCDGWHLHNAGSLSVIEELVPAGKSESRHYHERAQQFFYILSGSVVMEIEGDMHNIESGSGIHVPAGTVHQLFNRSNEPARFLVISTPRSHGDKVEA